MKEILDDLVTPYWWFSVIIVGIIINIVSTYLIPKLNKIFANYSKKIRNKNESKKRIWELSVKTLKTNQNYKFYQLSNLVYYQGTITLGLLLGILLFLVATFLSFNKIDMLIGYILATISFFISMLAFKKRNEVNKLFDELML